MADIYTINGRPACGPLFKPQKNRSLHLNSLADNANLTDCVYSDKSRVKVVSADDYTYENGGKAHVKPTNLKIIDEYKKMIKQHVERRIESFLLQFAVTYNTDLYFEEAAARDQGQSPDAISVIVNNKKETIVARQAAHSSTLPCLIAYDSKLYEKYLKDQIPKPKGTIFLEGTDYYKVQNRTENMPRWVNDADREIEERRKQDSLLRKKALALINQGAKGKIAYEDGIKEFMNCCYQETKNAMGRNNTAEVRKVLEYYKYYFSKFKKRLQNTNYVEQCLELENQTLKDRCSQILKEQLHQVDLLQKVQEVKQKILGKQKRKPDHFKAAFQTMLLEPITDLEERTRLISLCNFSPATYVKMLPKNQKTKFENTLDDLKEKHPNKIASLRKKLLQN